MRNVTIVNTTDVEIVMVDDANRETAQFPASNEPRELTGPVARDRYTIEHVNASTGHLGAVLRGTFYGAGEAGELDIFESDPSYSMSESYPDPEMPGVKYIVTPTMAAMLRRPDFLIPLGPRIIRDTGKWGFRYLSRPK